jgi:hypothetical protein
VDCESWTPVFDSLVKMSWTFNWGGLTATTG